MQSVSLDQRQPELQERFARTIAEGRLGHAYLFEGARGTGKKALARWLAQSLFCEQRQDGYPCHDCRSCRRMLAGDIPDVKEVQPDGQTIKVGQIRDLKTEFAKSAVEGDTKVYILHDAEKMTVSAANSLLTFLEEPGAETYLFLLTAAKENILPTIRSRCQIIHFQPLKRQVLQDLLKEGGIPKEDANLLAALTGDMEEARELAQSEKFPALKKHAWGWFQLMVARDPQAFLYVQTHLMEHTKDKADAVFLLDLLLYHYRDYLYLTLGHAEHAVHSHLLPEYRKMGGAAQDLDRISSHLENVLKGKKALEANVQLQGVLERIAIENGLYAA